MEVTGKRAEELKQEIERLLTGDDDNVVDRTISDIQRRGRGEVAEVVEVVAEEEQPARGPAVKIDGDGNLVEVEISD